MARSSLAAVWIVALLTTNGAVSAQESAAPVEGDDDNAPRTETGECFTTSAVRNMTVFNDHSIYVRTRTRHFLLTPSQECSDLLRAYNRNTVRCVPLGRRICPNDGSHFRYERGGRDRLCAIGLIFEVEDRVEAREIAAEIEIANETDVVVTEEIDASDQDQ